MKKGMKLMGLAASVALVVALPSGRAVIVDGSGNIIG